jgi:hypothetical protein
MAANLGQGRRTTISFLKDSWFQARVEDFVPGLPPNQRALDERSVAEGLAYEYGRLFATHCTALGRLVPCLPRRGDRERDCRDAPHEYHRGDRERDCRDAPHEYHRAQFVDRSSFPNADSGDRDQPFRPKVITDSGDRDHAVTRPTGSA